MKIQPQNFQQMSDEKSKELAGKAHDKNLVLNFLRIMDDVGYEPNIKHLIEYHQRGAIDEHDLVILCRALRYSYGMIDYV
jgi:hypothetical protein